MPTHPLSLSIFLPAYNEEPNLREAVEEAIRIAEASPYVSDFEVIIVNDGSTDATLPIARELEALYPTVRIIDHGENRGYGAALKSGIAAARKEYIFFTDTDLQFDILELQNLLVHLDRYHVVIGYRAPRQDAPMRLLNAKGWNLLNRLLFGLKVRDIDCAFKVFRRELIQTLPLTSRGAMLSAEILIRLTRAGIPIKEVPVSHFPRTAGSPTGAKPSVIMRALREMMGLYWGELGLITNKEVLKFMTVGIINTLIDVFAYLLLTRETLLFSEHLVVAKFFSFLMGTVSSLLLNRSWTFGIRSELTFGELARFYTATSLSIIINVEAMNLLVSLGVYDVLALLITTGITFVFNFSLSKFWVFRESPRPELARQA